MRCTCTCTYLLKIMFSHQQHLTGELLTRDGPHSTAGAPVGMSATCNVKCKHKLIINLVAILGDFCTNI